MPKSNELQVRVVALADIKPHPDNEKSRKISPAAFDGLKASIERHGLIHPITVNSKNMMIISGHQRHKALCELGVKEAPCYFLDLSPIEHQALMLTANNEKIAGRYSAGAKDLLNAVRNQLPTADMIDMRLEQLRNQVSRISVKKTKIEAPKVALDVCANCGGSGKVKKAS